MPESIPSGVIITAESMYRLLLQIDSKVNALQSVASAEAATVRDHEQRIREIEAREDLTHQVANVEVEVKDLQQSLKALQQRIWAFPSLAGIIAAVALVAAFSDKF